MRGGFTAGGISPKNVGGGCFDSKSCGGWPVFAGDNCAGGFGSGALGA